jgi:hypothetical protein
VSVRPHVPLPGKVVAVVEGAMLKKIAFVSVEEHVVNCAAFLGFVSPDKNGILSDALDFHDIGKKLFRIRRIYANSKNATLRRWGRDDVEGTLKQDYTATMRPDLAEPVEGEVPVSEVADAYLGFVGLGEAGRKKAAEGVKAYPVRSRPDDQKSPLVTVSYGLERPFGNHASPIKEEHLPEGLEDRKRLAALIRLHHGFAVPKIVPEAALWEGFPECLYRLMTLDHLGSSWAERLILLEEGGFKREFEGGVDFGEVESWLESDPKGESNPDGTKTISANVRLRRHAVDEDVVPFSVTYFVREVNYVDPSLRS